MVGHEDAREYVCGGVYASFAKGGACICKMNVVGLRGRV